jgi:hypothetical protein
MSSGIVDRGGRVWDLADRGVVYVAVVAPTTPRPQDAPRPHAATSGRWHYLPRDRRRRRLTSCETCVRDRHMTSEGSPYAQLRRAIATGIAQLAWVAALKLEYTPRAAGSQANARSELLDRIGPRHHVGRR